MRTSIFTVLCLLLMPLTVNAAPFNSHTSSEEISTEKQGDKISMMEMIYNKFSNVFLHFYKDTAQEEQKSSSSRKVKRMEECEQEKLAAKNAKEPNTAEQNPQGPEPIYFGF